MSNGTKNVNGVDVLMTDEEQATFNEKNQAYENSRPARRIAELRRQRDALLAETDWTQARDVTLSNDSAWQTYRQQLRDLPASQSDPDDVVFPTKP